MEHRFVGIAACVHEAKWDGDKIFGCKGQRNGVRIEFLQGWIVDDEHRTVLFVEKAPMGLNERFEHSVAWLDVLRAKVVGYDALAVPDVFRGR